MRVLIVGCGLYGTTVARKLAEVGISPHIIDKRNHIAGNCYSEKINNIHVHKYGPHAFHTNSKKIWEFVTNYAEFNSFKLRVLVNNNRKLYTFPVNLLTLNELYGCLGFKEAQNLLNSFKKTDVYENFEDFVINNVGEKIYDIFYKGYTMKQWGKHPSLLPASIAKRIPVRLSFYDYYFEDLYQGIPVKGYTHMFENILDHKLIKVQLGVDFFDNKEELEHDYDFIFYTGKIDEFFDYRHGLLEYRSLKFKEVVVDGTFQGNAQINYADMDVDYTRIVEHKYFHDENIQNSVITYEYPDKYEIGKIPYYPVESDDNKNKYDKYKELSENKKKYIFGGRLGRYTYLNIDQVIGMALNDVEKFLCQNKKKKSKKL